MKLSSFFSGLFAILGAALMILAVVLCFLFQGSSAPAPDSDAALCASSLLASLCEGDWTSAGTCLYGQPELTDPAAPEGAAAQALWQSFQDSLTYQLEGEVYTQGKEFYQDFRLSARDTAAMTAQLETSAQALLLSKAESSPETVYDEDGNVLPQVLEDILREASQDAAAQAPETAYTGRLRLICQEDRWYAIPEAGLWNFLSGGGR